MFSRAGTLSRRVRIEEPDDQVVDGEPVQPRTWKKVCDCWAAIRSLLVREYVQAAAVQAEVTHEITIRYRAGIRATMRIVYAGRVFQILGPPRDPDLKHERLVVMAKETT